MQKLGSQQKFAYKRVLHITGLHISEFYCTSKNKNLHCNTALQIQTIDSNRRVLQIRTMIVIFQKKFEMSARIHKTVADMYANNGNPDLEQSIKHYQLAAEQYNSIKKSKSEELVRFA
jgi:hypothetical protein